MEKVTDPVTTGPDWDGSPKGTSLPGQADDGPPSHTVTCQRSLRETQLSEDLLPKGTPEPGREELQETRRRVWPLSLAVPMKVGSGCCLGETIVRFVKTDRHHPALCPEPVRISDSQLAVTGTPDFREAASCLNIFNEKISDNNIGMPLKFS